MELKVIGQNPIGATRVGPDSDPCRGSQDRANSLSEHIHRRIQDHPCYSEEAHHHFARMHVAVAPACNIQCHYCNRKYDCANESRPGVVSALLTPEQAVKKTLVVGAAIPQLSVLGIAGPGDPLANPERTFATFRELARKAPDLKLCVSTNGLALSQHVDELVKYNIGHVTITINCVDPNIGAKIYPWIFWNNRRIRGRKAAEILIEQQQRGLEMLVERGVLVKINSVMIPGVNDEHLKEVNRIVKQKGAFLHNIMPLIARPEHGTFYGIMGQREPSAEELRALQETCAGDMRVMRHCHQCRSDAVGLLGQDRSAEFDMNTVDSLKVDYEAAAARRAAVRVAIRQELEKQHAAKSNSTLVSFTPLRHPGAVATARPLLVALASKSGRLIDEHFGHAREFLVYEVSAAGVHFFGRRAADRYCAGLDSCGDTETVLGKTIRALQGCEVLLCAKIGIEPWEKLESAGIQPNSEHALEPIEDAVTAVYQEWLASGRLAPLSASGQTRA